MINDFLDNVLADFEVFIQSGQDLCKLRDTHFDAGRIPDYSDINIQQLYLLRYVYAYAFEYKYMYEFLLQRCHHFDSIEVTSIGCGSMVDYWSLSRVVGDSCTMRYEKTLSTFIGEQYNTYFALKQPVFRSLAPRSWTTFAWHPSDSRCSQWS